MPILFPIFNIMIIDNGTFHAESTHSRRIRNCKNENNANPYLSIRCTIDENDLLGGRNIHEIRMVSYRFILDAIHPPLVRLDYQIPSTL